MSNTFRVVIVTGFAVVLFAIALVWLNFDHRVDRVAAAAAFTEWAMRFLGGFIAVASAFALLLLAIAPTVPAERVPVLVLSLLGGLMLMTPHWGLALATATVVAAMLWRVPVSGQVDPTE